MKSSSTPDHCGLVFSK